MKKMLLALAVLALFITGCAREAVKANRNATIASDQFEVTRRIVFYNGITNEYILIIEGLCSLGKHDATGELSVTCKTGSETYKKHFLGLSDNVTYFAEQIDSAGVSGYHYRVIFRPSTIIPDIELDTP